MSALIKQGKHEFSALERRHSIAGIELRGLSRQGLDRRIDIRDRLARQVQAWAEHRNASITGVDGQFTADHARIQLRRLYPEFTSGTPIRPLTMANSLFRP